VNNKGGCTTLATDKKACEEHGLTWCGIAPEPEPESAPPPTPCKENDPCWDPSAGSPTPATTPTSADEGSDTTSYVGLVLAIGLIGGGMVFMVKGGGGDGEDASAATSKYDNPVIKAEIVDEEQPTPGLKKIMMSGRFDGSKKEKFLRDTAAELKGMGAHVLVVAASPGSAGFGEQTMHNLKAMDVMVAFCFEGDRH
jgi:hypothetical protein